MKSLRFTMFVVLVSLSTLVFAQTDTQTPDAHKTDMHNTSVPKAPSEAQKSFTTMKSLAGEWEGLADVPEAPEMSNGKPHVSMRVTSRGHVLVHELQEAGTPLRRYEV